MLQWKALKHTKDVLVSNLRAFFNNPNNYQYLMPKQLDFDHYVGIDIFDVEPQKLRSFPVIIISGSGGNLVTGGIADVASEIYDSRTNDLVGYKYGGFYEFNLNLELGTRSTLDREFLSDITGQALRFALRRKMEAQGVLIKSMTYGQEVTVNYDSDHIYVANIQISTWSEWYHNDIFLPFDAINIKKVTLGDGP